MLISAELESEEWESDEYQESHRDIVWYLVVLLPMDDSPDAWEGHDTESDPDEDVHVQ